MNRATVHRGPKGGTEYRLWTGPETFRIVGRYKALPYMSPEERATADAMEAARTQDRRAKSTDDAAWRQLLRGG